MGRTAQTEEISSTELRGHERPWSPDWGPGISSVRLELKMRWIGVTAKR